MESIFDEEIERRGSGSYKWDSASDRDLLPMWVADMDFRTAPVIMEALRRRTEHGIFGYTAVGDDYYKALTGWFDTRHSYRIDRRNVIYTSGVVPALSATIKALTLPGDGVIAQTPVYNCFFSSIRNNGCSLIRNPLIRCDMPDGRFSYTMDFDGLEAAASRPDAKLLLLCNPHNPAGRAWKRDELEKVADICRRHGVRVISDEIHGELTMPGFNYVPYGTVDNEAVVCLSPSKAFNIAGLQIANIVCPDAPVREAIDRAININEVCDVNPFGVEALKAAYTCQGAAWLDSLRSYIHENYRLTCETMQHELPQYPISKLEATYLPWIDVRASGLASSELENRLKHEAKVWLNSGEMYGDTGYLRLNIACRRSVLAEGLRRMTGYLKRL